MILINIILQYIISASSIICLQIEFKLNSNQLLSSPFCIQKDCYNFIFNTIESFSWLKESKPSSNETNINPNTITNTPSFSSKLYDQSNCNQYIQTTNVLLPQYIYDDTLLQTNLHLSFPFYLIIPMPNCTILQPEAPTSASIGFGKSLQTNSDILSFYSSNYQMPPDLFSYQFLTDSIAKVYIGESSTFRYSQDTHICKPNMNRTNQLNCLYNSYTENIQSINSRVNGSFGEVYFNSIINGLYIKEDYYHWSLIVNHLIERNCTYTKVKTWMNIICPTALKPKLNFGFDDFDLSFNELFKGRKVNGRMISKLFIDERPGTVREIVMGLDVMKYYHIEFDNGIVRFEKNYIKKEWSVEVMTVFVGFIGAIGMLLYQIYKIDKSSS